MENDLESLVRSFMGGSQGANITKNFDKFAKILSTPEGKRIVSALTSDGGEALKKAASDAKNGDLNTAKSMLNSVMSTKEGADVVSKIVDASKN